MADDARAQTASVYETHRLQDAFTLATHCWNPEAGKMEPLPDGKVDETTRFLVLNEGSVVFHGNTHELVHSEDPWLKQYLA